MLSAGTTQHPRRPNPWIVGVIGLVAAAAIAAVMFIPNNSAVDTIAIQAVGDGEAKRVSPFPSERAVLGPDGRIYIDPYVPDEDPPADLIRLHALDPATSLVEPIDMPDVAGQPLRLLDVAEIQGELTILFATIRPVQCFGFDDPNCRVSLRTFQPGTGLGRTLSENSGWEFAYGDYALANNGLVVGSWFAEASRAPDILNVSNGPTPTAASLGLDSAYDECIDCPADLTIDRPGRHIAWLEAVLDDDGIRVGANLVIIELQTGGRAEVVLANAIAPGELQIADVNIDDGSIVSGRAAFTPNTEDHALQWPIDLTTGESRALGRGGATID